MNYIKVNKNIRSFNVTSFVTSFVLVFIGLCYLVISFYGIEDKINILVKKVICVLGISLIVVHFSFFAYYQCLVGKEHMEAVNLYLKSTDGKISVVYTPKEEIPKIVLNKTNGVELLKDNSNVEIMSRYYGKKTVMSIEKYCRK